MSGEFSLVPESLSDAATDLDAIGNQLDRLAETVPGTGNLGPAGGAVAGILAKLTSEAGNLVDGVRGAAINLRASRDTYLKADQDVHGNLPQGPGN